MMVAASEDDAEARDRIVAMLRAAGLVPQESDVVLAPLTGGVASDIWKVDAGGQSFVVKRALPKLKVAADWRAPISRNASEAAWFGAVREIVPECVPEILYHDAASGLFAMTYYEPSRYPVWKSQLMDGQADAAFAAKVGQMMARIHRATMNDAEMARRFANDETFQAIRLEPYLEATAKRHVQVADSLMALSRSTLGCHVALVHGDMSPKNILVGPGAPVFLDAECAWYGDPAFDLAFCLNHLLLKCAHKPAATKAFIASFDALHAAYLNELKPEQRGPIAQRAAQLLPALFLARVDGKSPVEYITSDNVRDIVRAAAIPLISDPLSDLDTIRDRWIALVFSRLTGRT